MGVTIALDLYCLLLTISILIVTSKIYGKIGGNGFRLQVAAWIFLTIIRFAGLIDSLCNKGQLKSVLFNLAAINLTLALISFIIIYNDVDKILRGK